MHCACSAVKDILVYSLKSFKNYSSLVCSRRSIFKTQKFAVTINHFISLYALIKSLAIFLNIFSFKIKFTVIYF